MKQTIASEYAAKVAAEKREQCRAQEEEQMAMIYGPNWKTQLPAWAEESKERAPEPVDSVEEDYEDVVVPLPRKSEVRFRRQAS